MSSLPSRARALHDHLNSPYWYLALCRTETSPSGATTARIVDWLPRSRTHNHCRPGLSSRLPEATSLYEGEVLAVGLNCATFSLSGGELCDDSNDTDS